MQRYEVEGSWFSGVGNVLVLRETGFEMSMPNPIAGMSYDPIRDVCLRGWLSSFSGDVLPAQLLYRCSEQRG